MSGPFSCYIKRFTDFLRNEGRRLVRNEHFENLYILNFWVRASGHAELWCVDVVNYYADTFPLVCAKG